MRDPDRRSIAWPGYAILALSILAPALGGATELWAQAAICLGSGALLIFAPPRRSLGFLPNFIFIALALLALTAFLPGHWFPTDDLHTAFSKVGLRLPATRSPQPWLTLQSTCLLLLGLAWAYSLLAFDWNLQLRRRAWIVYSLAILFLALVLTISYALKVRVPFWPDVREFGFFPNRNQTSNVLALGGIMIYAIGLQHFREHRQDWWLWLTSLALICWALILNYSRAGIVLLFTGALVWHICWLKTSKWRSRAIIAFTCLILVLVLFLAVGGETLTRFGKESTGLFSLSENGRVRIYRDALALLTKSPAIGIGLGNFSSIFGLHRQYSAAQNLAIHPESDWLWAAVEMGCIAPVFLAILFGWWIRQTLPFEPGTNRLLRVAAMICGCAFAVHGLFDVSGHRLGALWPALFLVSTAIHPRVSYKSSRAVTTIFRMLGLVLVFIGVCWFASISGAKTFPTTARLDQVEKQIQTAIGHDDYSNVIDLASEGLAIAPLDWWLYHKRAMAEAALFNVRTEAVRDFAVARFLLPNWPRLYTEEAQVWLTVGEPNLAFDAWEKAMQHFPAQAPEFYGQIYGFIKSNVALLDEWRKLGRTNKECLIIFLENAGPLEFEIELERLLAEDRHPRNNPGSRTVSELDSFSQGELRGLFSAWYKKGDKARLAQTLEDRPAWQKIGWRELARIYAERRDYRRAYQTMQQFALPPDVPKPRSHEPLDTLKARFLLNRTDLGDGLTLYFAQIKEGQSDDALRTVRELARLQGSPKYLFYLEAQLWAQKEDWENAWQALAQFDSNGH